MSASNAAVKRALTGFLAVDGDCSAAKITAVLFTDRVQAMVAATAAAATTGATAFYCANQAGLVKAIKFAGNTGVAASATDYATLNVYRNVSGTSTLLGTFATTTKVDTGAATAMTLTDTACSVAAGAALTYEITKSSTTGVATPAFAVTVELETPID